MHMEIRRHLEFVRERQDDVVVVQIPRDLRADRLRIECDRRCRRIAATSTATRRTHAETHLHDRHGMPRLRVNARIGRADVDVDVLEVILPSRDH